MNPAIESDVLPPICSMLSTSHLSLILVGVNQQQHHLYMSTSYPSSWLWHANGSNHLTWEQVYYLFQCVSILSTSMVIVMFVNMKQYSSTRDGWLCEHSCPGLCGQRRHPSLFHAKFLARVAPMLVHTKLKFADILLDSFKRNDVVSLGGQHKHSWIVLQGKLFQTKNTAEQIYSNVVSRFLTTGTSLQHQVSPDYVIRAQLTQLDYDIMNIKKLYT